MEEKIYPWEPIKDVLYNAIQQLIIFPEINIVSVPNIIFLNVMQQYDAGFNIISLNVAKEYLINYLNNKESFKQHNFKAGIYNDNFCIVNEKK